MTDLLRRHMQIWLFQQTQLIMISVLIDLGTKIGMGIASSSFKRDFDLSLTRGAFRNSEIVQNVK